MEFFTRDDGIAFHAGAVAVGYFSGEVIAAGEEEFDVNVGLAAGTTSGSAVVPPGRC